MTNPKLAGHWSLVLITLDCIGSLWNGSQTIKRASPIWKIYVGQMGLYVQHVILQSNHGGKLVDGWFVPPVITKRRSPVERSMIKLEFHLQHG